MLQNFACEDVLFSPRYKYLVLRESASIFSLRYCLVKFYLFLLLSWEDCLVKFYPILGLHKLFKYLCNITKMKPTVDPQPVLEGGRGLRVDLTLIDSLVFVGHRFDDQEPLVRMGFVQHLSADHRLIFQRQCEQPSAYFFYQLLILVIAIYIPAI